MEALLSNLGQELRGEAAEPAKAVVPLAVYLVLFTDLAQWIAGLDHESVFKADMIAGVPAVICGLTCFKWGLRKGLMPLGEQLGEKLPERLGEVGVSGVCFVLAIGLTFAEPAIGALQEAATLLDAQRAPLLATMFGNASCLFLLVLAIGVGVGVAAVTGSLRLLHDWDIKRMIVWALLPCLLVTVLCSCISAELTSVVGLAWDGGAVTTGPVTVPVVIALGIGLANAASRRHRETSQLEMVANSDGYMPHTEMDRIGCDASNSPGGQADLPTRVEGDELKGFGIVTFASLWPVLGVLLLGSTLAMLRVPLAASELSVGGEGASAPDDHVPGKPEVILAAQSVGPLVVGLLVLQKFVIADPISNAGEVALGVLFVFAGLVLFNLGLNFGLLPLGNAAGERMASAFQACTEQGRNATAVGLVLCFAFFGTFAAQVAEPSLNVLGETVERLTNGSFRRSVLVYVVALGVAVGTCVGVMKVLWDVSMWKILVPMYSISMALTAVSSNGIVCVAWDAGGVTTGSVTVPLILAMGLGLGKKRQPPVADGFGLLGCASVFPIVSVLLAGLLLDRCGRAARDLQRLPLLDEGESEAMFLRVGPDEAL